MNIEHLFLSIFISYHMTVHYSNQLSIKFSLFIYLRNIFMKVLHLTFYQL